MTLQVSQDFQQLTHLYLKQILALMVLYGTSLRGKAKSDAKLPIIPFLFPCKNIAQPGI